MSDVPIDNAGLVLIGPFIPVLFESLGLVESRQFVSRDSAIRAALILQYVATESMENPEYKLSLNKILSGVSESTPMPLTIEITSAERETIASMLSAVIEQWSVLGNTSVEGFRESFLNREGLIAKTDDHLVLTVQDAPFDMLIDRIPWSYSSIKYPWMDETLRIVWR